MSFDKSKTDGAHHRLSLLAGEWEGTTRVYFDESKVPADESPVSGTIRPVLDGRFMLHEYKGSFGGKPLEGIAIYGYDLTREQFQCAWADSFHMSTGILFSEDKSTDKILSVLGSYAAGEERWGWKTEITMDGSDQLTITATNLTPAGEPAGGAETVLNRKR